MIAAIGALPEDQGVGMVGEGVQALADRLKAGGTLPAGTPPVMPEGEAISEPATEDSKKPNFIQRLWQRVTAGDGAADLAEKIQDAGQGAHDAAAPGILSDLSNMTGEDLINSLASSGMVPDSKIPVKTPRKPRDRK